MTCTRGHIRYPHAFATSAIFAARDRIRSDNDQPRFAAGSRQQNLSGYRMMSFAIERMGDAAYFASVSHPAERRKVWAEYQQTLALLAQLPDAVNAAWNDTVSILAGIMAAQSPAIFCTAR